MGDTEGYGHRYRVNKSLLYIYGYGSASTPDSVTEKDVHQTGSDSQDRVWRDRQHRHWERSVTGMYHLTTAIQYLRRKHNNNNNGRNGSFFLRGWLPHRGRAQMACNYCFPMRTNF